jgi:hypothetical protein
LVVAAVVAQVFSMSPLAVVVVRAGIWPAVLL